jgi:hypothetical protein
VATTVAAALLFVEERGGNDEVSHFDDKFRRGDTMTNGVVRKGLPDPTRKGGKTTTIY